MSKIARAAACLAAALMAACGGGGSDAVEDALTQELAQGYAADAGTAPVVAAQGVDSGIAALEAGMANNPAPQATERVHAQAGALATLRYSVGCANDGTVTWTVEGLPDALLGNGLFDVGETFQVTFNQCAVDNTTLLNGTLRIVVVGRDQLLGTLTTTVAASGFQVIKPQATYTLDGSLNEERTGVTTPTGGLRVTSRHTSSGLTLTRSGGASYQLQSMDWNVVRTYDAAGTLTARSHRGTLTLVSSTPRRPRATLEVTAAEDMVLKADDGYAASGSFRLRTGSNTVECTYFPTSVTLTLDRGNDGSIDRRWTLDRNGFISAAG